MKIRLIAPDEHEAVGALTVAAYAGTGMPLGDYAVELADVAARAAGAEVLVAVEDGRVLGGVTYVPGPGPYAEFDEPQAAGIRMLAVAPQAQGRGVGEALVRACLSRAAAGRRTQVVLHTTTWMTGAHRLYERLGFARAPDLDWEPEPGLLLLGYRLDLS